MPRPDRKPWEAHTGATIKWIDLVQTDCNARLQQSIATGTVDFDIVEMGAPCEGDVLGRGMASVMPDRDRVVIDLDDCVDDHKAPVGTCDGRTYHVSIDGDCRTFARRTDYFADGSLTGKPVPTTWQEINAISTELKGMTDPLTGLDAHGDLDPLKGRGGFDFHFVENRAVVCAKHPNDPARLFDLDMLKPRVNNPAWVQAIQDAMDLIEADVNAAGQINADPHTTASTTRAALAGNRSGTRRPTWPVSAGGFYVMAAVDSDPKRQKAAWPAAAHLGGRDLSLWAAAFPSGFQPYRNSHVQDDEWEKASYDRALVEDHLGSNADSCTHPIAAIEPRIPGIFQYYPVAEDDLARGFAGQYGSAWENITDQIGREQQIALHTSSLGMM